MFLRSSPSKKLNVRSLNGAQQSRDGQTVLSAARVRLKFILMSTMQRMAASSIKLMTSLPTACPHCGLFHVGVEVMGVEWAYGWSKCGTGVAHGRPRSEVHHRFREAVHLFKTHLSQTEIVDILHDLMNDYRGRDYNLVENNCCHFAEDFCQRLGVGSFPAWVQRLGRGYDGLQKAARSLGAMGMGPSSYSVEQGKLGAHRSKSRSRSKGITGSRSTRKEILCM